MFNESPSNTATFSVGASRVGPEVQDWALTAYFSGSVPTEAQFDALVTYLGI